MTFDVNKSIFTLRHLRRGEKFVYYTGFLARDRNTIDTDTPRMTSDEAFVADEAMKQSEKREVHLLQERVSPRKFDYIAIGR